MNKWNETPCLVKNKNILQCPTFIGKIGKIYNVNDVIRQGSYVDDCWKVD